MDRHQGGAPIRKASIKETGEELSADEWARFDAAVAEVKAERERTAALRMFDGEDQAGEASV